MKKKWIALLFLLTLAGCGQSETAVPLPEDEFLVIAHRGASAYVPEHTIAAYELAMEMGADYLELDLQRTKDGELIVMHDKSVQTEQGKIAVKDATFNEIKTEDETDADGKRMVSAEPDSFKTRIVSSEEVFRHFRTDANYYIELKAPSEYPGMEEELLEQLESAGLLAARGKLPPVILQSFNAKSLKHLHKLEPSIPLIQLYSFKKPPHFSDRQLKRLARYASGIGINKDMVTEELIQQMHAHGLAVHPYTVNDAAEMADLKEIGADGVFTDKPDVGVDVKEGSE